VFVELLKQAIAEAEAMFDHPLKQYALFRKFEEKVEQRDVEGVPDIPLSREYRAERESCPARFPCYPH
jgi:hypothetical protein